MSKQSDAKAAQGYEPKPIPKTCCNCLYLKSDRVLREWMVRENQHCHSLGRAAIWSVGANGIDKNLRCTIGGFAVKKMAACNQFAPKIDFS